MSLEDFTSASFDASLAKTTDPAKAHRKYLAHEFPLEYWWTVRACIGVLTLINVITRASQWYTIRRASSAPVDTEKGSRSLPPRSTTWFSRSLDAVASATNILLFRLTIPLLRINVAEFVIVAGYFAGTVTWALCDTTVTVATNWMGRAGMMAMVQIPFVVALSGKNNVISFLTGISHEKLNLIHRFSGRSIFVIVWMHAGSYLRRYALAHESLFDDVTNRWGLVALISLTLTAVFSIRIFRAMAYEAFLMMHIATMVCFILGVYMHQPGLTRYIYPGFIFWGFDRSLRVARMVYLNIISRPNTPVAHTVSAKSAMERISEDTVRLSVRRSKTSLSSWKAGQHFFIIAPGVSSMPWEAHPFTPCTIPQTLGTSAVDSKGQDVELDFIIRGRSGFTGKLLKAVVAREIAPGEVEPSRIIVDGPYGQPPNLGVFDTAILIAGGSGVSYTLSMLLDRIHKARLGEDRTTRVLFVWVMRDIAHVNWIAGALQSALDSNSRHPIDLDIRIFVTQGRLDSPSAPMTLQSSSEEKGATSDKASSTDHAEGVVDLQFGDGRPSSDTLVEVMEAGGGSVKFFAGRPNVSDIIDQELSISYGRKVSVAVSGPNRLAASVRSALVSSPHSSPSGVLNGGPSVTLHTETFGW